MYRGEGPGPITRDGCAVELYLRLPYRGELDRLADVLPARGSVLELGCGVGRMTRPLLANGHAVTAVDNSLDMLAHVPIEAQRICADIETLRLDARFDVVLFASRLINTPDDTVRLAQLESCRRHLSRTGVLIFERFDPDWLRHAAPRALGRTGDVELHLDHARHAGDDVAISLRYRAGAMEWMQHFSARALDDGDIDHALSQAGFAPARWLDRTWGCAHGQ